MLSQGAYQISAASYDILQAERDRARVRRRYAGDVKQARVGVLDVGAGIGRVTLTSLTESQVPVGAVEPTHAMRSPLMSRLASNKTGLRKVACVAICHNTVVCHPPTARRALWPVVAVPVPGGTLLRQLSLTRLPLRDTAYDLPIQRVGEHEYGGTPDDAGRGGPDPDSFRLLGTGRGGRTE